MTSGIGGFLDRDGVINEPVVRDGRPFPPRNVDEVVICAGAAEACATLLAQGFTLVGVSNQPDIARGTASLADVEAINEFLKERLGLAEIKICPHDDADNCDCRKPKPGMILESARQFDLDLARSVMVGDRWRDIEAGIAAGCRTVFIDRGYSERQPVGYDHKAPALIDAVPWIIEALT